jgi:hypothetical protein
MNLRTCLAGILAVAGAMGLTACGGGGGSTPPAVNVTITTDVTNVETFQTVQFAATVTGTSNTAVTWQLSCNTTPASVCGTLSASGLYVAPNTVPTIASAQSTDPATLTVTAISQANSNAGDSVGFTIDSLNMQAVTTPPIPLGTSGGNANAICLNPAPGFCFGGTLGSLVTGGGKTYILSNNHVLGMSDGATAGQEVTQPGVIETNCSLIGTMNVATVSTIINLQTQPAPPVDVTTAQITTGQVELDDNILELGVLNTVNGVQVPQPAPPVAGPGMAASMNELLAKSGRTTGLTCAIVETLDATANVAYETGCATTTSFSVTYTDEIVVGNMSNEQSFIGDGDSGSLAVDEATAQPVALMFAGSDTSAIGNPVADVLNALKAANAGTTFSFVGTATPHAVPGCGLPGLSSVKVTPQSAAAPAGGTAQRGQAAAANYSTQIMNTPGVSAYGGGGSLDAPNEPAVLIFVRPGASHEGIPTTVDGVRTRIIESNSASARGPLSSQQSTQLASESAQTQAMEISASAIEQTKSVKEQHVTELMSDPAVVGVGVSASLDSPGDPALMIYVLKGKAHQAIPASVDGVRTRIKETSPFRANVAHPLKSPVAAGCHVPKNSPATTLNSAPPSLQTSAPSPSVQPMALTTTQR